MAKWQQRVLGDCLRLLSGGTPSKSRNEYWDGDIPWVTCKDMKVERIHDTEDHLTSLGALNGTRVVPENTILFVVRGMILARHFPVAMTKRQVAFNQDLKAVEPADFIDTEFLFHWLRANSYEILGRADEAGHGTKRLQTDRLLALPINVPPLVNQRLIAGILSAYDELIENSQRRIKIQEAMARALYQEWFVRFRFPGHKSVSRVSSPLGKIPKEWLLPLADHVDFKEGPGLRNWQYRNEGIPFLNIRTLVDNDIDFSKLQFLDPQEVESKYQHFLLSEYDHVVSSSGTIGRIVTIRAEHLPLMLNTSIIRMRPKGRRMGRWLLKHYMLSDYFQNQAKSFAIGAAQANFGPIHLKQMHIIAPFEEIASEYEKLVAPLELQILALARQIQNLRRTRDLLLPRLISGQINVETTAA